MNILRKHSKEGYTVIHNDVLSDDSLSFRARGLAAYLISKPDNWIIRLDHLKRSGTEGEKAIRTAMQELATAGYLIRHRAQIDGKITTITKIADYPAFINRGTAKERINGYFSDIPISDRSGNGQVRNGEVLVSTEVVNTDLVSTKEKAASRPAGDDKDGRATLELLRTHPTLVYLDNDAKRIAMQMEQDYSLDQIKAALQQTADRHDAKIGTGDRGIMAPLSYARGILVKEGQPTKSEAETVQVSIPVNGSRGESYNQVVNMNKAKAIAAGYTIIGATS